MIRDELKKLITDIMQIDIDTIDNKKALGTIDEWDSFNNLMLISRVEDHFKVKFSVKDIEDVNTIEKIIEIVEKKVSKS